MSSGSVFGFPVSILYKKEVPTRCARSFMSVQRRYRPRCSVHPASRAWGLCSPYATLVRRAAPSSSARLRRPNPRIFRPGHLSRPRWRRVPYSPEPGPRGNIFDAPRIDAPPKVQDCRAAAAASDDLGHMGFLNKNSYLRICLNVSCLRRPGLNTRNCTLFQG